MRRTERDEGKIHLHLSASGRLSFDIREEMSAAQPKQRQAVTGDTCLAGLRSCSQQKEDELSATLSTLSHSRVEKYTTVNTDKCHQTVRSHNR